MISLRNILSAAALAASSFAAATASYNETGSLALTTANLSGQGIWIGFTKALPELAGNATNGTYFASGYATFLNSRDQLNYTLTTTATGSAGPGVGNAFSSAYEHQLISFFNTSKTTAQTFTVNWTYNITGAVTADANGSADGVSSTGGSAGAAHNNAPYFVDSISVNTPGRPNDSVNRSGTITLTVNPYTSEFLYVNVFSKGFANSWLPAANGAPGPAAALPFLGALGTLLRRKRR